MHWHDHAAFLIYEADPAAARDRVVGSAETFDEARAGATRRNLAALRRDGAPTRAPFVFYYAAGKNGVNPCPVRDPDERSISEDRGRPRGESSCRKPKVRRPAHAADPVDGGEVPVLPGAAALEDGIPPHEAAGLEAAQDEPQPADSEVYAGLRGGLSGAGVLQVQQADW